MRVIEIELWARSVAERVEAKQPHEDHRVELKSVWPTDVKKAARQLAAHSNSARGEPILWLIGIDEDRGVVGAAVEELSAWYPKIEACFDGVAPEITEINIPHNGKTYVALLFDTDRAPFVIKNPLYGSKDGSNIEFEVPLRMNRSTRTAGRADLIKLLVPAAAIPEIEILTSTLSGRRSSLESLNFTLHTYLYFHLVRKEDFLAIPYHRFRLSLEAKPSIQRTEIPLSNIGAGECVTGLDVRSQSATIRAAKTEVLIDGPGTLVVASQQVLPCNPNDLPAQAKVLLEMRPVGFELPITLNSKLRTVSPTSGDEIARWEAV